MKRATIMAAAVLAACGGGEDNSPSSLACDTTYGYSVDTYGNTGLTLKATREGYAHLSFESIEAEYKDLAMCVAPNVVTPGPVVEYRSFQDLLGATGGWGATAPGGSVYINTTPSTPRNCHSDRATLRHEFVHYVLYMNGQDRSHANPAFAQCAALGARVCDGIPCAP